MTPRRSEYGDQVSGPVRDFLVSAPMLVPPSVPAAPRPSATPHSVTAIR